MTLLVDPALLWAGGYALGKRAASERSAQCAGALLSGAVLAASVATYRDSEAMRPVWTRLGGRSGRDLILNSWVLRFDADRRSSARTVVVGALFAAYPLWTAAGVWSGHKRRPRSTADPARQTPNLISGQVGSVQAKA
jgi:hypothetical protein